MTTDAIAVDADANEDEAADNAFATGVTAVESDCTPMVGSTACAINVTAARVARDRGRQGRPRDRARSLVL